MKQEKFQVRTSVMRRVMHKDLINAPITQGKEMLLKTGAKGYYLGGGWWLVSGYSQDGKDVDNIINELTARRLDYEITKCLK